MTGGMLMEKRYPGIRNPLNNKDNETPGSCGPGAFSEQGSFFRAPRTDPARMAVLFPHRSGSILLTAASVFFEQIRLAFFQNRFLCKKRLFRDTIGYARDSLRMQP